MTVGAEKRAYGNPWGEEEELASIFKHTGEELCFDHHHLPCVCWLSSNIRLLEASFRGWNSCLWTILGEEDSEKLALLMGL